MSFQAGLCKLTSFLLHHPNPGNPSATAVKAMPVADACTVKHKDSLQH